MNSKHSIPPTRLGNINIQSTFGMSLAATYEKTPLVLQDNYNNDKTTTTIRLRKIKVYNNNNNEKKQKRKKNNNNKNEKKNNCKRVQTTRKC
jgi:hypothetical protein